jgi:hypothetical protein
VDLLQQNSKWYLLGMIPTEEKVERLAFCNQCGKMVKEVYYSLRDSQEVTSPSSDEENVPVAEAQLA